MILADLGADVVRIDRPSGTQLGWPDANDAPGRRRVNANLKTEEGLATLKALVEHADVLLEGYRPGVAERLGIGPDSSTPTCCVASNCPPRTCRHSGTRRASQC
ncbi:MAG: CoA transferase [Haloechinothrix sp.]